MTMEFRYEDSFVSAISTNVVGEKRSSYHVNVDLSDVQEPIISAPEEVRQIIERVLQTEKDKLYMKPPRNINDDILKIIKEVIK